MQTKDIKLILNFSDDEADKCLLINGSMRINSIDQNIQELYSIEIDIFKINGVKMDCSSSDVIGFFFASEEAFKAKIIIKVNDG